MANQVYESKEFDRLRGRRFKDYSEGHRRMYLNAIEKIKRERGGAMPLDIFEAGFGIGYGIQQMDQAGIVGRYQGVEPNAKSFNYVANGDTYPEGRRGLMFNADPRFHLTQEEFGQEVADRIMMLRSQGQFHEAFCIEVIEHVPMDMHLQFLIALRQMAPRLWFSSPDKAKSKEGVRTTKDWVALLRQARFEHIDVDTSNWTYLYECR